MPKVKYLRHLPSPLGYSETFLQAHVDKLSAAVNYLQDFPVDIDDVFPKQIFPPDAEQLKQTTESLLASAWSESYQKKITAKIFQEKQYKVVLAEYGLTGIGVFKRLKDLNIPLVVHFHGYDAYVTELLDRHKHAYKRMFDYSSVDNSCIKTHG